MYNFFIKEKKYTDMHTYTYRHTYTHIYMYINILCKWFIDWTYIYYISLRKAAESLSELTSSRKWLDIKYGKSLFSTISVLALKYFEKK